MTGKKGPALGLAGLLVLFGGSFVVPTEVATSSLLLNPFAWGVVILCLSVPISYAEDGRRMDGS